MVRPGPLIGKDIRQGLVSEGRGVHLTALVMSQGTIGIK